MIAPAPDLSDAELTTLAERLGQAVTRGELARETAIGELLDQADGGLTPVGAAEMIDHWNLDLPDYREAFEDLVGPPEAFVATSPDQRFEQARRLLLISLISSDIEDLGQDVAAGRRTRADAITALQNNADTALSTEDAGRLVDDWATVGIRHSRALRFLVRLLPASGTGTGA
ncbi:hypothetical protein NQK81_02425 [Amycolatopsis roodepoortensis]|uniref:hypothetical protein n=1 Tax=Amycolatopsis roodepoortensis TaxID=700274 RepID=UPI00214BC7B7|nr:hypothetical protein [Amycolatopsis roodepoortensis]UUV32330.1 hypothetical protein NQK81_02425 [Amycolatopsis roodepoortensis]